MEHETQPPPLKAMVIFLVLVVAIVAALTFKREQGPADRPSGPTPITVQKPPVDPSADSAASHLVGKIQPTPTPRDIAQKQPPVDLAAPPPELPAAFPGEPLANVVNDLDAPENTTESVGPRRHRVLDGDTLESLAERFLGDKSRAEEILAANRDLITNPELLPIGVELVIPPARAASPAEDDDELAPVAPSNPAVR